MAQYKVEFSDHEPITVQYAHSRENAIDKALNIKKWSHGQTKTSRRKSVTSAKKIREDF